MPRRVKPPSSLQPLGLAIKRLQHRHHGMLESRLAVEGGTFAQWHALRTIAQHPDSSSHRLAQLTFQTDQSFGGLANRMVERGLIERVPGGGRTLLHRLTPDGEAMLARGHAIADAVLEESFAPLSTAERAQLAALLGKLLGEEG